MIEAGVIEDYTYLWHDVRPHPNFGTVEIRVMDSQTRVEHTVGLAALVQALVKELCEHFEAGKRLTKYPHELVDLPSRERVGTKQLARRLRDRALEHAQDLGSADDLEAIDDLLDHGNGA